MSKSKILFIMSGSIACYKACQIVSKLAQKGHDIEVVATSSALKFVGAATLEGLTGKPPITDMFASGNVMDHIHLARWADLVLVAPATAHTMNKMAYGIGDDLATTLFLAFDFKKPFLIAPAMNTLMYKHPATQESLKRLLQMGVQVLESASGILACGETGYGRLLEPEQILAIVEQNLKSPVAAVPTRIPEASSIVPFKILITAGGTRERIDDVRVISNLSTGQTGFKLAQQLSFAGFDVELLISDGSQIPKENVFPVHKFSDFRSLQDQLKEILGANSFSHVIHAAAVSDYTIESVSANGTALEQVGKLDSSKSLEIRLKSTPKLLPQLKTFSKNPGLKVVGFKLTSGATPTEVVEKVEKILRDVDFVVHNDLSEIKANAHKFSLWGLKKPRTYNNVEELSVGLAHAISFEVKP